MSSTLTYNPHLCPADYADACALMHQLHVPAVDELLGQVWPRHHDEGTVLHRRPLTAVLRILKRHILKSGRQWSYAWARGSLLLPYGRELSCRPAHVAALRKAAEQSASLTCILQHALCC